jgi:hypothetical protein
MAGFLFAGGLGLGRATKKAYERFLDWFNTPESARMPIEDLAENLGLSALAINRWYDKQVKRTPADDADDLLAQIRMYAMQGKNPKYAELYAKITGLTDKKEEKQRELTADEYFSILSEAEKRVSGLAGELNRNQSKQPRPEVPDGEVCVHREQEYREEGQMGSVAVSA